MLPPLPRAIDEPIELPSPAPPPRRGSVPLVAAVVPVVGGVVMWAVTGSLFALCFAALGPLMAIASVLDGIRSARRARRRARREIEHACDEAAERVAERHAAERIAMDAAAPDVTGLVGGDGVWRRGSDPVLVVARGDMASAVTVRGGEGEKATRLRESAAVLSDAPIVVPSTAGVCVRGAPVLAEAVLRGLLLQLSLALPPDELALLAPAAGAHDWTGDLPHRGRSASAALRLAVGSTGSPAPPADVVVAVAGPDDAAPPACGAVLDVLRPGTARLTWGSESREVTVECVSRAQAASIAAGLARRAASATSADVEPVLLAELLPDAPSDALSAAIGREGGAVANIDLVSDGPHAVVVGVTGTGKSELLVTWVTTLAATRPPDEVVFLLADFKGGTAFDALAELPHVTGVITDLDGDGARRAVESLGAELRAREAALAAAGARDIADPGVRLPRLVIVVDEFAALLQAHPDLHAVFTDVAARGRALGMHLVLGTQRSAGVLRDALVANCPLRVALRVAEPADSRAVIGTSDAAELPGGTHGRGVAFIRRAGDGAARLTRIALTRPDDIRAVVGTGENVPRPRGPWLPPLPRRLEPGQLPESGDGVAIGLCDEPARQRQSVVLLRPGTERGIAVVGGAGSGKSTFARSVAEASEGSLVVPSDAEAAWDAVEFAEHRAPRVLVIDDLDALIARFPPDYSQEFAARLERLVREAGDVGMTMVLTAARLSGATARIVELLPRRALLALPTRAEHVAAGGTSETFDPRRPPGRALLDGLPTQFPLSSPGGGPAAPPVPAPWVPVEGVAAVVVRGAARRAAELDRAWPDTVRVTAIDDIPPGTSPAESSDDRALVLVGDPDGWQRQWGLLQEVRARHPLVIGSECATELRTLAGERELPPYARPRAGRAWLTQEGAPPRRITLPSGRSRR